MISDIQIVAEALRDRAGLKPSIYKATQALEAFERVIASCSDDSEALNIIHDAQQSVTSRGLD